MCLLNAKFVFVTGGLCDVEPTAKCHRYEIYRNIWQEMPHLNEARMFPGSYQLAGHIYVCSVGRMGRIVVILILWRDSPLNQTQINRLKNDGSLSPKKTWSRYHAFMRHLRFLSMIQKFFSLEGCNMVSQKFSSTTSERTQLRVFISMEHSGYATIMVLTSPSRKAPETTKWSP